MENQYTPQSGQQMPRTTRPEQGEDKTTKIIITVFIIAIIGAVAYFQPWKSGDTTTITNSGAAVISTGSTPEQGEAAKTVLEALGKIMLLPTGDEPVIYAIENAQELIAQQAFFTGSQNGDTLIIFPQNQKAIIYSSARNVVVNAGPLSTSDEAAAPSPAATTATPSSAAAQGSATSPDEASVTQ